MQLPALVALLWGASAASSGRRPREENGSTPERPSTVRRLATDTTVATAILRQNSSSSSSGPGDGFSRRERMLSLECDVNALTSECVGTVRLLRRAFDLRHLPAFRSVVAMCGHDLPTASPRFKRLHASLWSARPESTQPYMDALYDAACDSGRLLAQALGVLARAGRSAIVTRERVASLRAHCYAESDDVRALGSAAEKCTTTAGARTLLATWSEILRHQMPPLPYAQLSVPGLGLASAFVRVSHAGHVIHTAGLEFASTPMNSPRVEQLGSVVLARDETHALIGDLGRTALLPHRQVSHLLYDTLPGSARAVRIHLRGNTLALDVQGGDYGAVAISISPSGVASVLHDSLFLPAAPHQCMHITVEHTHATYVIGGRRSSLESVQLAHLKGLLQATDVSSAVDSLPLVMRTWMRLYHRANPNHPAHRRDGCTQCRTSDRWRPSALFAVVAPGIVPRV